MALCAEGALIFPYSAQLPESARLHAHLGSFECVFVRDTRNERSEPSFSRHLGPPSHFDMYEYDLSHAGSGSLPYGVIRGMNKVILDEDDEERGSRTRAKTPNI